MFLWFSACPPEIVTRLRLFGISLLLVLAIPVWAAELVSTPLAPGVYAILSPPADPTPLNMGRVVNTGFIVGTTGVVVIDSGANHRHGMAILDAVRKVTSKQVRLVVNTHPHPQNVLGNSAFAKHGVSILSNVATRGKMHERCPRCLNALTEIVGPEAMAGTRIRLPDRIVENGTRITAAGRTLRFYNFDHSHTEGDLAMLDEASGTFFAGDLVYRNQIPHLSEASTRGWLAALEQIESLPIRRLVPGRGPVGDAGAIAVMRRYLGELRERVGEAYEKGLSADEAIAFADLPEFSAWEGYPQQHGMNVQHVYFEFEREDGAGNPP